MVQVAAHGSARHVGVVRGNGVDHGAVFVHRGFPGGFALKVAAQFLEQGAVALVKQLGDYRLQCAVVAGLRNADVKGAVPAYGQGACGDDAAT